MIDPVIQRKLSWKIDADENLLWTSKSEGVFVNRFVLFWLLVWLTIGFSVNYFFSAWLREQGGGVMLLFIVIALWMLFLTIVPMIESYGLSNKKLYTIRHLFFPFITTTELTPNTSCIQPSWAGQNCVLVHETEKHIGFLNASFSYSGTMVHGIPDPETFMDFLTVVIHNSQHPSHD